MSTGGVFTVQDGDGGVASANAYITEAEYDTYVNDRGLHHSHSSSTIQHSIVMATDYIDYRFQYIGKKRSTDQSTEWPRYDAYDNEQRMVNNIPRAVKEACAELAWVAASATNHELVTNPDRDSTGQTVAGKKTKVDVIESEIQYMGGGVFDLPSYPRADMKLRRAGLVVSSSGDIRRA